MKALKPLVVLLFLTVLLFGCASPIGEAGKATGVLPSEAGLDASAPQGKDEQVSVEREAVLEPVHQFYYVDGSGELMVLAQALSDAGVSFSIADLYDYKSLPEINLLVYVEDNRPAEKQRGRFWESPENAAMRETLLSISRRNGASTRFLEEQPVASLQVSRTSLKQLTSSLKQGLRIMRIEVDSFVYELLDVSVPLVLGMPHNEWDSHPLFGDWNGENAVIAILDTGIRETHPDLDDLDDDPETYDPKVIGSINFSDSPTTDDLRGHGTHVAGTAAGTGEASNYEFVGMAPKAQLLNVKVMSDEGWGLESWAAEGVTWAKNNGADIISMSTGGGFEMPALHLAIQQAVEAGVVIVAAAGNGGLGGLGTMIWPGAYQEVIGVGAVDDDLQLAWFSSRGPTSDYRIKPDVVAPGVDICAPKWDEDAYTTCPDLDYISMKGTSMATPHVSGLAAILRKNEEWSPQDMKSVLITTAEDLGYSAFEQGGGFTQAQKAIPGPEELSLSFFDQTPLNFGVHLMHEPSASQEVRVTQYANNGEYECKRFEVSFSSLTDAETGAVYESILSTETPSFELASSSILFTVDADLSNLPPGLYTGEVTLMETSCTGPQGRTYKIPVGIAKAVELRITYRCAQAFSPNESKRWSGFADWGSSQSSHPEYTGTICDETKSYIIPHAIPDDPPSLDFLAVSRTTYSGRGRLTVFHNNVPIVGGVGELVLNENDATQKSFSALEGYWSATEYEPHEWFARIVNSVYHTGWSLSSPLERQLFISDTINPYSTDAVLYTGFVARDYPSGEIDFDVSVARFDFPYPYNGPPSFSPEDMQANTYQAIIPYEYLEDYTAIEFQLSFFHGLFFSYGESLPFGQYFRYPVSLENPLVRMESNLPPAVSYRFLKNNIRRYEEMLSPAASDGQSHYELFTSLELALTQESPVSKTKGYWQPPQEASLYAVIDDLNVLGWEDAFFTQSDWVDNPLHTLQVWNSEDELVFEAEDMITLPSGAFFELHCDEDYEESIMSTYRSSFFPCPPDTYHLLWKMEDEFESFSPCLEARFSWNGTQIQILEQSPGNVIDGACIPHIPQPDLVITDIDFNTSYPYVGDNILVSVTTQNIGNADAPPSITLLVFPNGMNSYAWNIGALAPGESETKDASLTLCTDSGTYDVSAEADLLDMVIESNESNNQLSVPIICHVHGGGGKIPYEEIPAGGEEGP